MKVALAVHRVTSDTDQNLSNMICMVSDASEARCDLVLFPEAAPTGLINNDDPTHDLPLGQAIPGPTTEALSDNARANGIYVASGVLERDGGRLYDSAVLIDPDGKMLLKYRRIQPQWHGRGADPAVYCQGTDLPKADTPFGSIAFLVCGDLFDDEILRRTGELRPDWVLFPFARCFNDGSFSQERWDNEEREEYVGRVRSLGISTLMTNYVADKSLQGGAFGGALAITGDGQVKSEQPLGRVGLLITNL
jgi:predicted amidohydrolase